MPPVGISGDDPHVTVVTHHASGATAMIHSLGATVLSFVDGMEKKERLFVSKLAQYNGNKAIRGGIPLCFPQFGPSSGTSTMPQHGFARLNYWQLQEDSIKDDEELGATATFVLDYVKDVKPETCGMDNAWNKETAAKDGTDCKLLYEIKVLPHELIGNLTIQNTGKSSFSYQVLYHSYFAVDAKVGVEITGLGGYSISDRVKPDESGKVQSYDNPIVIVSKDPATAPEVDRTYIHPDDHPVMEHVTINKTLAIEAAGQVEGQDVTLPVSCVVWNPGPEKSQTMTDFDNDEYQSMICVEPGLIGHQPLLAPNTQARFSQSIRLIKK